MDSSLVILVFALLVTSTIITTMAQIVIAAKHDNSNSKDKSNSSGVTSGSDNDKEHKTSYSYN